jgi:hypothetical protein
MVFETASETFSYHSTTVNFCVKNHKKISEDQAETPIGTQLLQITKARDETPSESSREEDSFLKSERTMTTAMKVASVHTVTESSPRIRKKTNGSGALSVSRGVTKTAHLIAVNVLHFHAIFPSTAK